MVQSLFVECTHPVQSQVQSGKGNAAQRRPHIIRLIVVDFPDEFQGEVKLSFILPARTGYAAHEIKQFFPHVTRGAKTNKETMHEGYVHHRDAKYN